MFRIGDKIVCVDNYDYDITYGKTYEVIRVYCYKEEQRKGLTVLKSDYVLLLNDSKCETWSSIGSFLTLKEYRKQKLCKILQ